MAERFFAKTMGVKDASEQMYNLQTNKGVLKGTITVTPVSRQTLVVTYYNDIPVVTLSAGATVEYEYGSDVPTWSDLVDVADGDSSTGYVYVPDVGDLDMNTIGEYTVTLVVEDASGNASDPLEIDVTIVDTTAPVITDAETLVTTYVTGDEEPSSWLTGVTANDGYDGNLTSDIVLDVSAVDMTTVGTFDITYDVDDANGNSATTLTKTITITST